MESSSTEYALGYREGREAAQRECAEKRVNFLIADEKHGKRYIHAQDNTIDTAATVLLGQRIEEGHWYYDEEDAEARSALAADIAGSHGHSWLFLKKRSDDEYEYEMVTAGLM